MGKFNKVLLATDFDGTFASSDGTISERNIERIRYFMSEGGRFTVCTGRTYQGFHKYNREYINAPVLLCNGAMAYDYESEKPVFINGMGENALKLTEDILKYSKKTGIELYPFNKTFLLNALDENKHHVEWQDIKYEIKENTHNIPLPICKMMIYSATDELDFIYNELISQYDDIDIIHGYKNWMEIIKNNFNKGTGLLKTGELLDILPDDIYAVGDGYNDIDMLKVAKISFAPSNSDERTKQTADRIVCSNDDGCIADVIDILDGEY